MKNFNIDRCIAIVTIIGWAVTVGIGVQEFRQMRKAIETMQEQMFDQQYINGVVSAYIELDLED